MGQLRIYFFAPTSLHLNMWCDLTKQHLFYFWGQSCPWWLWGWLLCLPSRWFCFMNKKRSASHSSDLMDFAPHPGISNTNKSPIFTGQDMKDIGHSDHRPCASQTRVCVCGKERECMHAHVSTIVWFGLGNPDVLIYRLPCVFSGYWLLR